MKVRGVMPFYMTAIIIFDFQWLAAEDFQLQRTFDCIFYFEMEVMTKTNCKLCKLLRLRAILVGLKPLSCKKVAARHWCCMGNIELGIFPTHTNTDPQSHMHMLTITRPHCFSGAACQVPKVYYQSSEVRCGEPLGCKMFWPDKSKDWILEQMVATVLDAWFTGCCWEWGVLSKCLLFYSCD